MLQRHGSILDLYRKAAGIIEASGLDYTLLRSAWVNDRDEIDYATTQKGEPFGNAAAQVYRKSVADLVVKLAMTPGLEIRSSLESTRLGKKFSRRRALTVSVPSASTPALRRNG